MRRTVLAVLAILLAASRCGAVRADDTDIYLESATAAGGQPLVMLSLDYRANLTRAADATAADYFRGQGLDAEVAELERLNGGGLAFFDVLLLSLKQVLREVRGARIGLMLSHNQAGRARATGFEGEPAHSNGGVVLMGFRSLDDGALPELEARLLALKRLKSGPSAADHPYQGAELFYEFFRYLTGQAIHNGHHGALDFESGAGSDPATNMRCGSGDAGLRPACWDPAIENLPARATYRSPLEAAGACGRIFTVNFLFQVSQQDDDAAMFTTPRAAGGLGIAAPASQNDHFPAVLGFLRDADLAEALPGRQNVTSWFVVSPGAINATTRSYAVAGGTREPLALADDPGQLVETLRGVFQQILSVSATLVAPSVPADVFNRAEVLDRVYLALFQADPAGRPFWDGNLKKLKLGRGAGGEPSLVDALGQPAISPLDGRLLDGALSLWTDATAPELGAGDGNGDGEVDPPEWGPARPLPPLRDGREVPRGGAGQKIPGFRDSEGGPGDANGAGKRNLFYLGAGGELAALDASSTVAAAIGAATLGTADAQEQLRILRFARGQDVHDDDADGDRAEARRWIMGDPLHSRPLPINYGAMPVIDARIGGGTGSYSAANPALFVAIAGNDGVLRLLRDTLPGAGAESGEEVWAFMPEEGLRQQRRLMRSAPAAPGEYFHPYSFDGEPTALVVDRDGDGTIEAADGDRVVLYAGLRRGGRRYYALDVTDPYTPRFLWRLGSDGLLRAGATAVEPGSGADFAELGLAFSRPRAAAVPDAIDGTRRLAVLFGGGYHGGPKVGAARPGKDARGVGTHDPVGNAVFVVDALGGALLWKAVGGTPAGADLARRAFVHPGLRDSVPSGLTVVDTDGDGLHDRVLFGDSGGNLWRADLGGDRDGDGDLLDDWRLARLACLGRHGGPGCGALPGKRDDRRFFHEPDLVQGRDPGGARYDAVIVGSGDRENPLDKAADESRRGERALNRLFMVRDPNVGVGAAADLDLTAAELSDVTDACVDGRPCSLAARGWRLDLVHDAGGGAFGEKALSAPLTVAHSIYFTTYAPPPLEPAASCGPAEGSGFLYALRLENGAPARDFDASDAPGSTADRRLELGTPGIPAQVVYLGSGAPAAAGNADGGAASPPGCVLRLMAGARVLDAPGCPRFRGFWQRLEYR